ncbi:MAG: ABC transporter substrate-binding protein [Deltaproteobacteria bacterium]|nr:ABC transporter substrate-binding protein [Deltaproteobacteria bacterium]
MKSDQDLMLAALGIMLLLLIAGCVQEARQPVVKMVLGTQPTAHNSPVWIAESKGYFQEEGLKVEIREFTSGQAALQNMLNTKGIDLATAAQTPVIYNSFRRNDYAIIGSLVYSDKDLNILARQDKGIKAAEDLKGKTIGITTGTSSHFFLCLFLTNHQMELSDVKMVDLEPARLSEVLIQGKVDAIVTWEPYIYQARKILGDKALLFPNQGLFREEVYFIARKDYLKDQAEASKRFLRAIEKGEAFILKNRKEAKEIVSKRLKIEIGVVNATWDDLIFRLYLDQSILVSLEDHARWAIINRLTDKEKVPNYLDYIHTETLQAVKPGAVSIAGR